MEPQKDRKPGVSLYEVPSRRDSDASDKEQPHRSKRRQATVYDAVAGKVSSEQGLQSRDQTAARQGPRIIKHSSKNAAPLAPDEVLFRRKDAPERYLEHDIYHAHERDLPRAGQGVLPESDLLKAIHGYASRFYAAKDNNNNNNNHHHDDNGTGFGSSGDWKVNERSMDETALLALGVLLEEAGKETLGRRGDLVFTEGAEDGPGAHGGGDEVARDESRVVGHQDIRLKGRGPKRRKVESTTP